MQARIATEIADGQCLSRINSVEQEITERTEVSFSDSSVSFCSLLDLHGLAGLWRLRRIARAVRRRLVQNGPKNSELPNCVTELLEADGFDDIRVCVALVGLKQVALIARGVGHD